ncbi:S-layer homology domain-containing protein [Paenibacillus oryzisoli]|uniref:S-layer homology domain-containing protein n=1 Tax=Paenibacillus oryzisoli TaxID=1850517 RepID=UPI003D2C40FF
MRSRYRSLVMKTLVTAALLSQTSLMSAAANVPTAAAPTLMQVASSPFAALLGKDYEARGEVYRAMKVSAAGWEAGMVVSKEPYAVVTKADANLVQVRIWTGVIARDYNDLLVFWDEIGIKPSGELDYHATDVEETTRAYFESASQEEFRVKAYLGKVPWANIPTDSEAAQGGAAKVTASGVLNVYGIAFDDPDRAVAPSLGVVKQAADIPEKVPALRQVAEKALAQVPTDAEGHWAKDEIVDLMKRSIIDGYEDHTIRPNRTLSKGEFITLLVKSLGVEPVKELVVGYEDMGTHWSAGMVATAQGMGLLDKRPVDVNFSPDLPMTRVEMAALVDRVLQAYGVKLQGDVQSFQDAGSLTEANRTALTHVVQAGIVGGYEDGTFRPQGSLTRAEAFKVISRIIHLL